MTAAQAHGPNLEGAYVGMGPDSWMETSWWALSLYKVLGVLDHFNPLSIYYKFSDPYI